MKRFMFTVILLLSILVTALSAHAASAQTLHYSFKGQFAEASFNSVDWTQGIATYVYVFAVDGRTSGPGHPATDSSAAVSIIQYNIYDDTVVVGGDGFATLTPDQFVIDKQITGATLNAT